MKFFSCACLATIWITMTCPAVSQQSNQAGAGPSAPAATNPPHGRLLEQGSMGMGRDAVKALLALYQPSTSLRQEAEFLFDAGDSAGAEQKCQQAFAAAPVIDGRQETLPEVHRLLGSIYLTEGQNRKALNNLLAASQNYSDATLPLDIALAHVRLGNYEQARKFYSDHPITQYRISDEPLQPEDLPGVGTAKSLEASILFARGLTQYFQHQRPKAEEDFESARRLAPDALAVNYFTAKSLLKQRRFSEARPLLEKVVASPRGAIFHDAKQNLDVAQAVSRPQRPTAQPATHQ